MIKTFTETFPSFVRARSDADQYDAAPAYFSPTFDLDDAGNSRGEFHCSLELRIVPVSDVNMGFESGKANQTAADRQRALSAIVFASDLAEADDWAITDPERENGIRAFSQTLYSGATIVGHYRLALVHNANNEVGVYTWYEGLAGATGFTIYAEFRASFTPSDAPSAEPVSSAGGLTAEILFQSYVNASTYASFTNGNTIRDKIFGDGVKFAMLTVNLSADEKKMGTFVLDIGAVRRNAGITDGGPMSANQKANAWSSLQLGGGWLAGTTTLKTAYLFQFGGTKTNYRIYNNHSAAIFATFIIYK